MSFDIGRPSIQPRNLIIRQGLAVDSTTSRAVIHVQLPAACQSAAPTGVALAKIIVSVASTKASRKSLADIIDENYFACHFRYASATVLFAR